MLKLRWQLAVMVPFAVIVTVKGMNWVESWEPVEYGICDWLAPSGGCNYKKVS